MAYKNCCFKGRGRIALLDYKLGLSKMAGLVPVGNASTLSVTLSETTEKVQDFTNSAGGVDCVSRQIEGAEIALTLLCHSAENLAFALYSDGVSGNVIAAAVVGELQVAYVGALVPLLDLPDTTMPITVTSAVGSTTYVAGIDYSVTESGSLLIPEGSTIAAPTVTLGVGQPNIKVSYQRMGQSALQLFSRPSKPVLLHFDGVNIMDGTRAAQFKLFKVKFGPSAAFTAMGDNASKLELKGEILRDDTRPLGTLAAPFSQYGTLKL